MAVLWQLSVVSFSKASIVSGVLVNAKPHKKRAIRNSFLNFYYLIRSYFLQPLKHKNITVLIGEEKYKVRTNKRGFFVLQTSMPVSENIKLSILYHKKKVTPFQSYSYLFKESSGRVDVISDIDDTIIVSNTANFLKRIFTFAFVTPHKRRTINFTSKLLQFMESKGARVFYVSRSESNLFGVITEFIRHNNLPEGALFLTPYIRIKRLIHPKKGKDFKFNLLKFIIENSVNKNFILVGDDSQKDIDIYTKVVELYPDRILRVYIRQTKKSVSLHKYKNWNRLVDKLPEAVYFNELTDIETELDKLDKMLS